MASLATCQVVRRLVRIVLIWFGWWLYLLNLCLFDNVVDVGVYFLCGNERWGFIYLRRFWAPSISKVSCSKRFLIESDSQIKLSWNVVSSFLFHFKIFLQLLRICTANQKLPTSITKNMKEKFSASLILQEKVEYPTFWS